MHGKAWRQLGLAVVLMGVVLGAVIYMPIRRDDAAFRSAWEADRWSDWPIERGESLEEVNQTMAGYEAYLKAYPHGRHADVARDSVEGLAWKIARHQHTQQSYEAYLQRFPQGKHRRAAENGIVTVAWEKTQADGTIAAYERFASTYATDRRAREARREIEALKVFAEGRSVHLYDPHPPEIPAGGADCSVRYIVRKKTQARGMLAVRYVAADGTVTYDVPLRLSGPTRTPEGEFLELPLLSPRIGQLSAAVDLGQNWDHADLLFFHMDKSGGPLVCLSNAATVRRADR